MGSPNARPHAQPCVPQTSEPADYVPCHGLAKSCFEEGKDNSMLGDSAAVDTAEPWAADSILKRDKPEPIAIIGMAIRFPQETTSPEALWNILMEKRSTMTTVPSDRFNIDAFYNAGERQTGVLNLKGGHFISEDISGFDAPFFSMSPEEAECVDPQQRWLLETAYEALENAGISMEGLSGSKTSVYIGSFMRDYEIMLARDPETDAKYKATGTGSAMLANRLSWFYNLIGPSISIDTACSSSLTALHLACEGLRSRDASMSLVGGCNLFFNPESFISLADLQFLSPESHSYSFDHRANGYSRGEGFGVVVLKPLSLALKDGNTVRSIIRATGINQDGRTPSIAQPSSAAQESLIRTVYEINDLDMSVTRFFEAHGTGTPVGDPIEAKAINAAFGEYRSKCDPLYIGAIKSNLGHLEGASGMAGLIKTVLVLEKGIIPPNALFERPNPDIPVDDWNITFPSKPIPWPTTGLRRASLSSFGFGGANAHAVLDDAYNFLRLRQMDGNHTTSKVPPTLHDQTLYHHSDKDGNETAHSTLTCLAALPPKLFVWSAFDEAGLKRVASAYEYYLKQRSSSFDDANFFDRFAFTLSQKRRHMPWRSYAVARSIKELMSCFGEPISKPTRITNAPRLRFIMSGQGAQWPAMGRDLLEFPIFAASLRKAEAYLRDLGCKWLLVGIACSNEMMKSKADSNVQNSSYSQPICTALQIALIDLLSAWGVEPEAVVGHSSGEIAAAYCVGALSCELAWRIAYYRGAVANFLRRSTQECMSMMAVTLSETDIGPYFQQTNSIGGHISVACINSPKSITISGCSRRIDALKLALETTGVFVRKIDVDVAYHTILMDTVAETYRSYVGAIQSRHSPLEIPIMFSSVTGERISRQELCQADYWVKNLVAPVRFSEAVQSVLLCKSMAIQEGRSHHDMNLTEHQFLEIGPHSTLKGPIRDIFGVYQKGKPFSYDSVLVRGESGLDTALTMVGRLYCKGHPVRLAKVSETTKSGTKPTMLVDLPGYQFNHTKKFWLESRVSKSFRFRKYPRNELLGTPASDWNPLEARWRHIIKVSEMPWVADHKIHGIIAYPAAGMLVMAIEAVKQLADHTRIIYGYRFRDVAIGKALTVSSTDGTETQIYVRPSQGAKRNSQQWNDFRICECESGEWAEVCTGSITAEYEAEATDVEQVTETSRLQAKYRQDWEVGCKRCTKTANHKDMYEHFESLGLSYGPSFQSLRTIHYNDKGEATAFANMQNWATGPRQDQSPSQPHVIHPAALDAIFQSGFPALTRGGTMSFPTLVPTKLRSLWISAAPVPTSSHVQIYAKASHIGLRNAISSVLALDAEGGDARVVGEIEMTFLAGQDQFPGKDRGAGHLCHQMDWKPDLDLLDTESILSYCSVGIQSEIIEPVRCSERDKKLACYLVMAHMLDHFPAARLPKEKALHLEKYYRWMDYQITNHSYKDIVIPEAEWKALAKDDTYIQQLYARVKVIDPEGRAIITVAENLSGVLSGETDALSVLFGDGTLMEQYYNYTQSHSIAFSKLERYIDAFAHKKSDLKVLEVGAGTGGATEVIINTLQPQEAGSRGMPRFTMYAYTDISSSFFEDAKKKFAGSRDRMTFSTLNIEHDPTGQGFEAGEFDLIIASHVLHATKSIESTLRNTRKLLKRGGKLLIYETIRPENILPGYVFGLLPGWWLGKEESRKWGPLITENEWNACLLKSGFSGIDLSFENCQGTCSEGGSILISTAVELDETILPPPKTLIVTAACSAYQQTVAARLKASLEEHCALDTSVVNLSDTQYVDLSQSVCIFLPELENSILHNVSLSNYTNLQRFVSHCHGILWMTNENANHPTNQMVMGFARCIRDEYRLLRFVTVSLRQINDIDLLTKNIERVFQSTMLKANEDYEREYVERSERLCIGRIVDANNVSEHIHLQTTPQPPVPRPLSQKPYRPLKLGIANVGMLDTLEFTDDLRTHCPLPPDEIEIEVQTAGLNFRDVLMALGQMPFEDLGGECAGIVTKAGAKTDFSIGDRVVGFVQGSFATLVRASARSFSKIPGSISFSTAAGLPSVFCTAHYALSHWARMKPGESILIHSGAGGFGQATIQLAKLYGAEIFATVGNQEKKRFLIETYGIREDHIFSSRSLDFAQGVKRMTHGRGVDVVVNSLAGEALRSSWECIAPLGRFIEVGKKDVLSFGKLPMYPFAENVAFACVDLYHIFRSDPTAAGTLLKGILDLYMKGKITGATPLHTYSASQVETAFRFMQAGQSVGKIVVEFRKEDIVPTVPSVLPSYAFDQNATYVITGGLGGLGRCTARWMANRNAKHLLLLGRHGAKSDVAKDLVAELRSEGLDVFAPPCDVSDQAAVATILATCSKTMPPIKGCIVGSMVLKDAAFEIMSHDDFHTAVKPKVQGSWNLHTLLPKGLDFFILLSSFSGLTGLFGQSNYGSGNAYQDALAHRRVAAGEKAVALDLGVVLSVGHVAEHQRVRDILEARGYTGVRETEYLALLDYYCNPALPVLSSLECQVVTGLELPKVSLSKGVSEASWTRLPMFRHLHQIEDRDTRNSAQQAETSINFERELESSKSFGEAEFVVLTALVAKVARLIDLEKESIGPNKPLHAYGIDSLAAVELRNWFRRDLGAEIAILEILGNKSIAKMANLVANKSRYLPTVLREEVSQGGRD